MDKDTQQARSLVKNCCTSDEASPGTNLCHHVQRLGSALRSRVKYASEFLQMQPGAVFEPTNVSGIEVGNSDCEIFYALPNAVGLPGLLQETRMLDPSLRHRKRGTKFSGRVDCVPDNRRECYLCEETATTEGSSHDAKSECCDETGELHGFSNEQVAPALQSSRDSTQESARSNICSDALCSYNNVLNDHVLDSTKMAGQDAIVLRRRWKQGLTVQEAAGLSRKLSIGHSKRKNRDHQLHRTSCSVPRNAQNRREGVIKRLKILKELLPDGTKTDLATMLETTVKYVELLELRVKVLAANDQSWTGGISGRQIEATNIEFKKVNEDDSGSIFNNHTHITDSHSAK